MGKALPKQAEDEYDLAMEGDNLKILSSVAKSLLSTEGPIKKTFEKQEQTGWDVITEDQKAEAAYYLLEHIDEKKGEFAQAVADRLASKGAVLKIPDYISNAVIWACGGTPG